MVTGGVGAGVLHEDKTSAEHALTQEPRTWQSAQRNSQFSVQHST